MQRFIILICSLLISTTALADPGSLSVAGYTLNHGSAVVVSGTDFGAHPSYREGTYTWQSTVPLNAKFKDFQDGLIESMGFTVANNYDSNWSIASSTPIAGSNYARQYYVGPSRLCQLGYNQSTVSSTQVLYASFWMRADGTGVDGKPFRWYYGDDSSRDNTYWAFSGTGPYGTVLTCEANTGTQVYGLSFPVNTWTKMEFILDFGNEYVRVYRNGTQSIANSGDFFGGVFDPSGHSVEWGYIKNVTTGAWLFDDLFIDYTQARVELCAGSTAATRGVCEPQIPTAWSTTSASFLCNFGSFTTGSTRYLYVVKSDGTRNANGLSVTLGEAASDTTAPAISGHSPANLATDVPIDSDISFVLTDGGSGVNLDTVQMDIEGANHCCSQMVGTCPDAGTKDLSCTGTAASLTVTKSSNTFTNEQVVNVSVDASDQSTNAMATDTYSFTTTPQAVEEDTTDPVVAITSPSVLADYVTTDSATSIAGTASDNVALASPAVAWSNSQGGSGNAAGSTSWSVDVLPLTASTFDATLVTNGTFDSDYANWTANNATLTQGTYGSRANCLSVADAGVWSEGAQTFAVENGALYYITALAYSLGTDISENGSILVDLAAARTDTWGDLTIPGPGVSNTWTTIRGVVRAVGTSMTIRLHSEEGYTAYFDSVVVRKVTAANVITTTATDTSANTATDTLTIVYDPPAAPEAPVTKVIIHDASGKAITFSITGVHIVESE